MADNNKFENSKLICILAEHSVTPIPIFSFDLSGFILYIVTCKVAEWLSDIQLGNS